MLSWFFGYKQVIKRLEDIKMNLDALTQAVEREQSVTQSALTLIRELGQKIQDANGDQAKLDALVQQLNEQGDQLAQAVSTNTPAEGQDPSGGTDPNA